MKAAYWAPVMVFVLAASVCAQQFTPPALPAGAKTGVEMVEAEIVKIYSLEDQGATYRSYVVKYKGTEVVVNDTLGNKNTNVGDKIKFTVARVSMPSKIGNISTMSFNMLPSQLQPKK